MKPRIHVLPLGGTIATLPDASSVVQMGLGAQDLIAAVPGYVVRRVGRQLKASGRLVPYSRNVARSSRPTHSLAVSA